MVNVEKMIKVLEHEAATIWSLKESYKAQGNKELAKMYLGQWISFDEALTMLKDEALVENLYNMFFGKEAPNVDVP